MKTVKLGEVSFCSLGYVVLVNWHAPDDERRTSYGHLEPMAQVMKNRRHFRTKSIAGIRIQTMSAHLVLTAKCVTPSFTQPTITSAGNILPLSEIPKPTYPLVLT